MVTRAGSRAIVSALPRRAAPLARSRLGDDLGDFGIGRVFKQLALAREGVFDLMGKLEPLGARPR